ncbi:MAG: hypothetical protein Q4D88_02970 [Anaerococcus sp.]|nr:hypothetical protein [Anaerococcus sp.]
MKSKMKMFLSILSSVTIFTMFANPVFANGQTKVSNKSIVSLDSWAGRLGGNGDGSEEYLEGSFGQMNGPYKKIGSTTGKVVDFNNTRDIATGITFSIATGRIPSKVLSISTSTALSMLNDHIEGIYYKTTTYVSGRRAKLAIQTYSDETMTEPYKYYEEIKK